MPIAGPTDDDTVAEQKDSVSFDTFSGLRNTVSPERMGPRELQRGRNIDIDDAGQIRRRRGRRVAILGRCHSLHRTPQGQVFVVKDGTLVAVRPDYSTAPVLAGIGPAPLAYATVGQTLYFTSPQNSAKVDIPTLGVKPWCRTVDPSYQPGLDPAPEDWWFSPVANPEETLAPVAGRLLGPPPLGEHVTYFNGRLYIAAGNVLWATELFTYDYVDKTKGYRQFEDTITGLGVTDTGIYVGTTTGLYFLSGRFGEEQRILKEEAGVISGTMIQVPGEVVSPEGKRRPDIPQETQKAISCMTTAGMVVGIGGNTYNLTRASFVFPQAFRGSSQFRRQDGMHTIVTALDSGGTPRDNARVSDYCDVQLIRAADVTTPGATLPVAGLAGSGTSSPGTSPASDTVVTDVAGNILFGEGND